MLWNNGLTIGDVFEAFSEEVAVHHGSVADNFNDGSRLFSRGVLPRFGDVQPRDRVQGGVAIKATEHEVCLHPYVFRLVCSNGAIMAQCVQSFEITEFWQMPADEAIANLRQAVGVCCEKQAFNDAVQTIRSARDTQADQMLALMPMLSMLPQAIRGGILKQIMDRFFAEGDKSQFGLMNAVTSVARDTADPEVRWNLEELGGAIPIAASDLKPAPRWPAGARRTHKVLVG